MNGNITSLRLTKFGIVILLNSFKKPVKYILHNSENFSTVYSHHINIIYEQGIVNSTESCKLANEPVSKFNVKWTNRCLKGISIINSLIQ